MKKIYRKILSVITIASIICSFVSTFFVNSEVNAALSSSYTQYIKSGISAFPESYQRSLAYLKYLHPNWEFKAYYTGISWSELTSSDAENRCLVNTIHKGDLLDPAAVCVCGRHGDPGYYCASAKTVNYYLDPRNFLGEAMVFQFLDLSNGSGVTREVVSAATSGTYLNNYVDSIMTAANEARINPLHIVATIFQEIGRTGNPRAISGTVPGYEGLYNFYNYGATDGQGAVERGLAKARELGWTTREIALIDGAKRVLANGYISAGQTTKYFYKFDVVGNEILTEASGTKTYASNQFFNHQYMTNLRDPSSQAGSLYDIYAESKILDEHLTFTIPVYDNMPQERAATPTSLTATWQNGLYYVNSLKKWGVTLRTGPSYNSGSLGNLYKDTVVLNLGTTGAWTNVRIYKATTYNSQTKGWNYVQQDGYMLTEYLQAVGTEVPDYRGQVDMGGNTEPVKPPTEIIENADIKIENEYIMVTPVTSGTDIIAKYPSAVIKNADGTDLQEGSNIIATGMNVVIDQKKYIVVKLGDVNCDGDITPADYVKVKNNIMNSTNLEQYMLKSADVNNDGSITPADYVKIKNHIMNVSSIGI